MEPLSIATTLGKLLGTGYGIYKAVAKQGSDLDLDLDAYKSLVELGGQFSSWLPQTVTLQLQAQVLAILTTAFGHAFREHFGPRKAFEDTKRLEAHFAAAIEWAKPIEPPSPSTPPVSLSELLAEPEKSTYFAALWRAFTKRDLPGKAGASEIAWFREPLIEEPSGEDRLRFEQIYRHAVMGLLAAPAGRDANLAMLSVRPEAERAEWVERLLVADMTKWNRRHVFGNVRGHDTLPHMPLASMYVEPNAVLRGENSTGNSAPIRDAVRAALEDHQLVVVTADFGHGKSLTARTLAYEMAGRFLTQGDRPRAELARPVFMKCQSAVSNTSFELTRAAQRAQWLALKDLAITTLRETDPALLPPATSQRTLYLIDGLDEVAFLERGLGDFFEHLRGQLTANHRAIVFSRPHSVPYEKLKEWGIPIFELKPFDAAGESLGQVGEWLAKWNACSGRAPIAPAELERSGFLELAQTPILLFMIAYTWGDLETLYADWKSSDSEERSESRWDQQHRLYESFFRAIAWGKYELDRDKHPLILRAATKLREALESRGLLPTSTSSHAHSQEGKLQLPTPKEAERDALTEAMLWLMARIAWEARCLEQEPKPKVLNSWRIAQLLERELELEDPKTLEVIRDGLLLAMQADLSESSRPILFGHKSFREFLVSRCWAALLLLVSDPDIPHSQKAELVAVLRRGRLRDREDHSFDFLRARLRQWNRDARRRLFTWAESEFRDDRIESSQATLSKDNRRDFRATALALATTLAPEDGFRLGDQRSLRSLLASYWIVDESATLWAPRLIASRLSLPRADLSAINLEGANLEGAKLVGANLDQANLCEALLRGANLARATLHGARLRRANLDWARVQEAKLLQASLPGASLTFAQLQGAILALASLQEARLQGTQLQGANLNGAQLQGAQLQGANLGGASLVQADLRGADLRGAQLQGARLGGANLVQADLRGADLRGVHLERANLEGATLDGANLEGAILGGTILDKAHSTHGVDDPNPKPA